MAETPNLQSRCSSERQIQLAETLFNPPDGRDTSKLQILRSEKQLKGSRKNPEKPVEPETDTSRLTVEFLHNCDVTPEAANQRGAFQIT